MLPNSSFFLPQTLLWTFLGCCGVVCQACNYRDTKDFKDKRDWREQGRRFGAQMVSKTAFEFEKRNAVLAGPKIYKSFKINYLFLKRGAFKFLLFPPFC